MSGIFNWLIEGYRLLQAEGLTVPEKMQAAIEQYQQEADIFGSFVGDTLISQADGRIGTSELYGIYKEWAELNGYRPLSNRSFTGEIRRRHELRRDGTNGNILVGFILK